MDLISSLISKIKNKAVELGKKVSDWEQPFKNITGNIQMLANPQTRATWFKGFTPNISIPSPQPKIVSPIPYTPPTQSIRPIENIKANLQAILSPQTRKTYLTGLFSPITSLPSTEPVRRLTTNIQLLTKPQTRETILEGMGDVLEEKMKQTYGEGLAPRLATAVTKPLVQGFTRAATAPFTKEPLPRKVGDILAGVGSTAKAGESVVVGVINPVFHTIGTLITQRRLPTRDELLKSYEEGVKFGTEFGPLNKLTAPILNPVVAKFGPKTVKTALDLAKRMALHGLKGGVEFGAYGGLKGESVLDNAIQGALFDAVSSGVISMPEYLKYKSKQGRKLLYNVYQALHNSYQQTNERLAKGELPIGFSIKGEVGKTLETLAKQSKTKEEFIEKVSSLASNPKYQKFAKNVGKIDLSSYFDTVKPKFAKVKTRVKTTPLSQEIPVGESGGVGGLGQKEALKGVPQTIEEPQIKEPPASAPPPSTPPPSSSLSDEDLIKRLTRAIKEAKPLRGKQEELYRKARGEKLARLMAAREKMAGEKGFYEELGALKGELPKVEFETIRNEFTQENVDRLFNMIKENKALDEWEKINTQVGLEKILGKEGGGVPTKGELEKLYKVFGKEFTEAILEKRPLFQKLQDLGMQLYNLPRSTMAGVLDLSGTLMQNILFAYRHPITTAKNFIEQVKMFASEDYFKKSMEEIAQRPTYEAMKEAKVSLTEVSPVISQREEQFMSSLAEKIPGLGKVIRMTGRAWTGFLNKMRADVFDQIYKSAKETGVNVDDPVFLKSLGEFVNAGTGRGSLGKLERVAPVLSQGLFSARKLAALGQTLNPVWYIQAHPYVRKEALKTMAAFIGGGMTILGLAKLAGAEVGDDPTSTDFGKIKIGNTRFNVFGTYQQVAVLFARLFKGYATSSTTGRKMVLGDEKSFKPLTRLDLITRFFESKEHPTLSLIIDALRGQTALGQKFELAPEVLKRFIPMVLGDSYDLYKEHGAIGLLGTIPMILGIPTQTYGREYATLETTPSGKAKLKLKPETGLAEDIWLTLTGQPKTNIPEQQYLVPKLQKERQEKIEIEQLKRDLEEGKITGGAQVDDNILIPTKDGVKTLDLSKITPKEGDSNYQLALKLKKAFSYVDEVLDSDLSAEEQASILSKLGISPEDAEYYNVARQPTDVKYVYVKDEIGKYGENRQEMLNALIKMRQKINGKYILTSEIINDLVDEGILSYEEGQYLKNLKYDKKKGVKLTGRGRSAKIKVPKINISPFRFKTKAPKVKAIEVGGIRKVKSQSGRGKILKVRKVSYK